MVNIRFVGAFVQVSQGGGQGLAAFDAVITIPRVGAWHADFMVGSGASVNPGPASVSIGDGAITLQGNAFRLGLFADYVRMRVEGGNGTLRQNQVPAKSYRNVPLSVPLGDLVKAGGEQLSTFADPAVINSFLPYWTFVQQKGCGGQLIALMKTVPADANGRQLAWRMWRLPLTPQNTLLAGTVPVFDGAIWLGYENWPQSPLIENQDYVYEYEDQSVGKFVIDAQELPLLTPGVTFRGRQITYVRHEFTPRMLCRTNAYYEA